VGRDRFYQVAVQLLYNRGDRAAVRKRRRHPQKSILSVDGKESRGSKRQSGEHGGTRALQTLNVYSNDYGICLAQKFISEKTNEILAAQELLRLMDLRDTIVTADAMNCRKETGWLCVI